MKWTQEKINLFKIEFNSYYKNKDITGAISKFGDTWCGLQNKAISLGLLDKEGKIKKQRKQCKQRKPQINSFIGNINFFDIIYTEKQSYWLGFIFADGYVSDNSRLRIGLSYKDYEHLLKFSEAIGSNIKTSDVRGKYIRERYIMPNKQCYIDISSRCLVNSLNFYGVEYKIRKFEIALNTLPKVLHSHFIRGIFDGDGCVSITHSKLHCSIVFNTENDALLIRNIISKQTGLNLTKINKSNHSNFAYSIRWSGNGNALKFYNYLYKDAMIYLDRKKQIFDDILYPY